MSGDALYWKVSQLLQGNSFIDASAVGHTFYHRNVTVVKVSDTAVPYFYFAALSEQPVLYTPIDASAVIGYNQDFVIEIDCNPESYTYGAALWSNRDSAGNGILIGLTVVGQPFVTITYSGTTRFSFTAPQRLSNGVTTTIAFQRSNGTLSLYVNGVRQAMPLVNTFFPAAISNGSNVYIGADTIISPFNGYMRRYRLTLGSRYAGNYTPGIDEYPSFDDSANPVSIIGVSSSYLRVNTAAVINIESSNAVSLKAEIEDLYGNPVSGSAVTLTKITNANWQANIGPLGFTGRVYLSVTGYNGTVYTGSQSSKRFPLHITQTGAVDAFEDTLFNIGPCVSWVDLSDPNTVISDATGISVVNDKASYTKLDSTSKILCAYTNAVFQKGAISFSNASLAALAYETPVTCRNGLTLIAVLAYTGTQVGQGKGGFFVNDTGNANGKGFNATAVSSGSDYIDITENSGAGQLFQVLDKLAPAGKYVIALSLDSQSLPVLYINQTKVPLAGTALLNEVLSIGYIGSLDPNYKNLATLSTLIIYDGRIAESYLKSLSGGLNTLLNVYAAKPYSMPPTPSTGTVGEHYTGTISIYNATSATVSVTGGAPWTVTRTSGSTFALNGPLPNTLDSFSITINAINGADSDTSTFPITLIADDTTPVIYPPDTLICDAGLAYYGQIRIAKADVATVSCATGSGWAITRVGSTEYWVITGISGKAGTFPLYITGTNSVSGSNLRAAFDLTVAAIKYNPHVLPVNVGSTGLGAYAVLREPVFFQKENGIPIDVITFEGGPFRSNGFLLEALDGVIWKPLSLNVDYVFHAPLTEISQHTGIDFFGSIRLINPLLPNALRASYTKLGGTAGMTLRQMLESVSNYLVNDRLPGPGTTVTGIPNNVPIAAHKHPMSDIRGFGDLYAALYWLNVNKTQSHASGEYPAADVHRSRKDFPHAYTKADAGVGNIQNYPPTTPATLSPTNSTSYMTVECAYKMLVSSTGAAQASTTVYGVMLLNTNSFAGDAVDSTKGLTYAGLLDMLSKDSTYLGTLFSEAIPVQITPWPPVYPCYFKGYRADDLKTLFNIIETYYRQENINVRLDVGIAYLPSSIASGLTALTLDQASAYTGQIGFTTLSPLCAPMNRLT